MSAIYLFYATRSDLLAATRQLESVSAVKYVRSGMLTTLPPETFESAASIPNLGRASSPSAVSCESFLVYEPKTMITPRRLKTLTEEDANRSTISIGGHEIAADARDLKALVGVDRYTIGQLANPDTVSFRPGGLWKDMLLQGTVGTASESESSLDLLKRFGAALKDNFNEIKGFYIGPDALELLKHGKRLTAAEQSPREFDLRF
jgi:hypothetical protein